MSLSSLLSAFAAPVMFEREAAGLTSGPSRPGVPPAPLAAPAPALGSESRSGLLSSGPGPRPRAALRPPCPSACPSSASRFNATAPGSLSTPFSVRLLPGCSRPPCPPAAASVGHSLGRPPAGFSPLHPVIAPLRSAFTQGLEHWVLEESSEETRRLHRLQWWPRTLAGSSRPAAESRRSGGGLG